MIFMKSYFVPAALVAAAFHANVALAAPPASVVGSWVIQANQASGQLIISQQSPTSGACRLIVGIVFAHEMQGIYCPATGRIQLLRYNNNHRVEQVYTGNVGDAAAGSPVRMAGTVTVTFQSAGILGEYNFNASK